MTGRYRLGLVGVGKIARDSHVPAILGSPDFTLVATADPVASAVGVPAFTTLDDMLASGPEIDAVAICTPPRQRYALALAVIAAGGHLLLEKPPALNVAEAVAIAAAARDKGVTAFAAWHSREARAVAAARDWLAGHDIRSIAIDWREDVRKWHPCQEWIFDEGGFGAFDPGINALSILTALVTDPIAVRAATLDIPSNRASPVRAAVSMTLGAQTPVTMNLDFLETRGEIWSIRVETDHGDLLLEDGGARASVHGRDLTPANDTLEYPRLYRRFAALIDDGAIDVDTAPLALFERAMAIATRRTVEPFHFDAANPRP